VFFIGFRGSIIKKESGHVTPTRLPGALSHRARQQGFTLMEVLAALAVMSVAITIIITLFFASVTLAKTNRSRRVAATLAQEQIDLLTRQPALFDWPALDRLGELEPIVAKSGEASFLPPDAMPVVEDAAKRETSFYEAFTWEAFANLPSADAKHVELSVVVRWAPSGPGGSLVLTTAMPRARVEEVL
jgi:prepilin-type N-terminal cleavage/methylation domain-containing protein